MEKIINHDDVKKFYDIFIQILSAYIHDKRYGVFAKAHVKYARTLQSDAKEIYVQVRRQSSTPAVGYEALVNLALDAKDNLKGKKSKDLLGNLSKFLCEEFSLDLMQANWFNEGKYGFDVIRHHVYKLTFTNAQTSVPSNRQSMARQK